MKLTWLLGLAGAIAMAAGCGGDDRPKMIDTDVAGGKGGKGGGTGTSGKTGGGSGGTDVGGEGGGSSTLEGIDVTITAPAAASDPSTDEVLVDNEVTVACSVKASENDVVVDGSSVLIEVLDAAGDVAIGQDVKPLSAKGTPTGTANEYSASFPLTSVETGVVSFRCTAASVDEASGGRDVLSTFIDHGPIIVAKLPEADSAHALKGIMPVEFTVTPSPLSDKDDENAEITSVTLVVAGAKIDAPVLVQDPDDPTTYRAQVDFTDKGLFKDPPPEHTSIHIEAVNSRKPKAATGTDDYPIVVDGKGPEISYVSPKPNATVHGETVVEFTAADSGAGLDITTLELSLTGIEAPFKFDATKPTIWTRTGDNFKFRFDSLQLTSVAYQINVSIRAQDRAGNSKDGVTLVLNKDDYGPLIDLDPGQARGFSSQGLCSQAFDPLYEALSDLDPVVVSSNLLRALVYDRTNTGSGQLVRYMSGTDRGSVRLYIQPNPSQFLLKDSNNDGVCDALVRDDFKYVSLAPLSKTGGLVYGPEKLAPPAVDPLICTAMPPSSETKPTTTLCEGTSDMYGVVQHDVATGEDEPVVYAYAPSASGFECTGKALDLHNYTADPAQDFKVSLSPDGWICLAVSASDNLSNAGISAPLRICLDDPGVTWPGDGVPGCKKGVPAPSCLQSCSLPPQMGDKFYRF